ncbi:VWA domain-containing protein [Candidatus Woesearchaeota archaeon]|nr:VWA domain-containing protein [Candidatus Woesearchaeota archaeon]
MTLYYFQYPFVFIIFLGIAAILAILIMQDFIKFKSKEEQASYRKSKKRLRIYILVSRIIIFLLLAAALASPYTFNRITVPGNPSLTILEDKSYSFDIFEKGMGDKLKASLDNRFPIIKRDLVQGTDSALGDALLNNMQGNDNLLLITDGNSNEGKALADMMYFAASINTTVSVLDMSPIKNDLVVTISGPSESILGTESTFYVDVKHAGEPLDYDLVVTVDGSTEISTRGKGSASYTLRKKLPEGYHRIEAKLTAADNFKENNAYYKTHRVLPKPKLLFVSTASSPIESTLSGIYDVERSTTIPNELGNFHTVVVDNYPASSLNSYSEQFTDYIADGNGLIVIGGESAFDKGNYKNSVFETLLPVQVGKPETQKATSNIHIVVVVDVSGSSMFNVTSGISRGDAQKQFAIEVLKSLRQDDNVAVVAFGAPGGKPYLVSPLTPLRDKPELPFQLRGLSGGGNSYMYVGLWGADQVLGNISGVRHVIFISDGEGSGGSVQEENSLKLAESMGKKGIFIHTIAVGKSPAGLPFMRKLALAGNGQPMTPDTFQTLNLVFNRPEKPPGDIVQLMITDKEHFITKPISIKAAVSGSNEVYPKPNARMLVSTEHGYPILTVWRYGLGRVATISTDDGQKWAGDLTNSENYQLLTRTVNWAVGDPNRNKDFEVKVKDSNINKEAEVIVISKKPFVSEELPFYKIGENIYRATFRTNTTGFMSFFGATMAVNDDKEYSKMGMNPELAFLTAVTGGRIFKPNEEDKIANFVREASRREKNEVQYFRWPLLFAALFLFIMEIGVRKLFEK